MKLPIYMDHHSTTPVDPAVLDAMLPFFKERFGNAASRQHSFGHAAKEAVEAARMKIAELIHAGSPEEIIFTSGATESDNCALRGVSELYRERGNHIITTQIEHPAVLDTCRYLETQGFQITYLSVGSNGIVNPADVEEAVTPKTILISVMHANNEIGTVQPIAEIGRIAHASKIFFHSDAAQTAGKIPLDVEAMNLDLVSISAHKMYGPKGVGALYLRKTNPRVRIAPLIYGGGHERGLRSGTLNVPAIAGFGKASEIAQSVMGEEAGRTFRLRERLKLGLETELDGLTVNGSLEQRLPGSLNVSFDFVEGESLLKGIAEEIAVSSGSACSSARQEPSHVLKAIGARAARQHTSIRFGLGRFNTVEEVDYAIRRITVVVRKLREGSALYQEYSKQRAPGGS